MALARRLQVLVDDERFARLEGEARRRGVSIGALVREAIDTTFPDGDGARRSAARRLLAVEPMPVEDWETMKAELLSDRYRGLPDA